MSWALPLSQSSAYFPLALFPASVSQNAFLNSDSVSKFPSLGNTMPSYTPCCQLYDLFGGVPQEKLHTFLSPQSLSSDNIFFLSFYLLCSPGWPGTHKVSQANLKLTQPCLVT